MKGIEDEKDIAIYDEFQELYNEVEKLNRIATQQTSADLRRIVICHRDMYKLGKLKKVSPLLLYEIVSDGFMNSVKGFKVSSENKEVQENFKNDCQIFAKAAEKIQSLFGFSVPEHGVWHKRQNFDKWIKDYELQK